MYNLYHRPKHPEIKTEADFKKALATMPYDVDFLDLSGKALGNLNGDELARAFGAIPRSIICLDLSWNDLARRSAAELAQAFQDIPPGVKTIIVSEHEFALRDELEMYRMRLALPRRVTVKYDMLAIKTVHQDILKATSLPENLATLILSYETGAASKDLRALIQTNNPARFRNGLVSSNICMNFIHDSILKMGLFAAIVAYMALEEPNFSLIVSGAYSTALTVGLFAYSHRNRTSSAQTAPYQL